MKLAASTVCAVGFSLSVACVPAIASDQSHTYVVLHPRYGEIGSFTHTIERVADTTKINTHLHVAIKLLGIVAYSEESDGTEVFRGDKLVSIQNITNMNGRQIEVRGASQGDMFVVSSPLGTFMAPADVAPSDPWFVNPTGPRAMVSTKTGKVERARVFGGENVLVSLNGSSVPARHFTIVSDNRQEVWLGHNNVPLVFRTEVNGTQIDFKLKTSLSDCPFTGSDE